MLFKVGTYNIAHGHFVSLDMSIIAKDIKEAGLDIVGLQEVDVGTERVFGRDTLLELQRASGLSYRRFCKSIDLQGGGYGHAILSRFPFLSHRRFLLPMLAGGMDTEQRSAALATFKVADKAFTFANTHLCLGTSEARRAQFSFLAKKLASPFILTGDFNTTDFTEYEAFAGAQWINRKEAPIYSFHNFDRSPHFAIDNIVYTAPFKLVDVTLDKSRHSDHSLLYATFEI